MGFGHQIYNASSWIKRPHHVVRRYLSLSDDQDALAHFIKVSTHKKREIEKKNGTKKGIKEKEKIILHTDRYNKCASCCTDKVT